MVITIEQELEAVLKDQASQRGISAEDLALETLRERFLEPTQSIKPRDEWERRLLGLAKDCGVSLPDAALSRKSLYE